MKKVYDLHQHPYCVLMHIGRRYITIDTVPTSNRNFGFTFTDNVRLDASITYDKQRAYVKYVGSYFDEKDEDDIVIDCLWDRLYKLFKKDKETRDEEDILLLKAVSDYLPLVVKKSIEEKNLKIENYDLLHYGIVVPSEWEEEMRDDIIRPAFVQSGLISNQDHQDRLLFFSEIESLGYGYSFKRGDNTILYRVTYKTEKTIIKLDLVQTMTTLYNIPNGKLFPKVINSSIVSVPKSDIQGRIRNFLRTNLFPVATANGGGVRESLNPELIPSNQDQIIEAIVEGMNSCEFPAMYEENEQKDPEKEPWITFKKEWMLDESQKEFINSLCPSIVCAEIGTFLLGYMKDIVSHNFTKSYQFMIVTDDYSDWEAKTETAGKWIEFILQYNSRSLNHVAAPGNPIGINFIIDGAGEAVFEAIQHSDMYCKPRIVPSVDLTTSSSIFLSSKPDAIINLDISLRSTLLTCSLLDEDGLIQQIFDHNYFVGDKYLPPLGNFYTDTTTLNVKEKFIPFAEKYLLGDLSNIIADDGVSIKKNLLLQMNSILAKYHSRGEVLVSINQQKYIKAFILMYMIYIKEEIMCELPDQLVSDQMDKKIGYSVSIEARLLNNTLESKDNLRDIVYASGLVPKDDHSKKLRITTQGERILPAIQKSLELELSLKSYFLLCQLHENYVQLSLHQVVTALSPEDKEQESIIVQDEILAIQNIYDYLCSSIWHSLLQDSSLIKLCEIHNTSDNSKILDLLSSNIKSEFFANLKGYISDNVLQNNSVTKRTNIVKLTSFCNCKVHLTTSDIIDISFTPVLQDIACTISASLLNKELFGNYMNIDYVFTFIRFNNNPQLQSTFAKILEEEADDFSLELGIDTSFLVVPEFFIKLLQPVITEQPLCYKDFKMGALQQVYGENYAFSLSDRSYINEDFIYKSKITDTKTIECGYGVAFPFLNISEIMNNVRSTRKFYLRNTQDYNFNTFYIDVYRFKTMNYMENNETLSRDDNIYQDVGRSRICFYEIFKAKDVDVPVMVAMRYISYTSSFQFCMKIVGADLGNEDIMSVTEIGEPLTLTRF